MCPQCHGPLPRSPEKAQAADGTEWEFCNWRCAVLFRADQGSAEAAQIAAQLFGREKEVTT